VVADGEVQKIVDSAMARAEQRRKEKLGVTLTDVVRRAHATESPEGNLLCDLMLEARPDAQVTMTNGGGLRADLPQGQLTYGELYEAVPFDNRFAIVALTGKALRSLITANLTHGGGFMSWGGLTAKARCKAGKLDLQIQVKGKPLDDAASYKLATSDFLASGGDGALGRLQLSQGAIQMTDTIIREAMADVLRGWKGTPRGTIDPARLYLSSKPRFDYEGKRPLDCSGAPHAPGTTSASSEKEPAE
jgi:5'-nucleotidase